jgi:DNA-binding NarL/FixJ family response regulator
MNCGFTAGQLIARIICEKGGAMIRIAIIIKERTDRSAIAALLSSQDDFDIAGIGTDGYDALKMAARLHPDVIIMDQRMAGSEGPALAPLIKRRSPATALIVFCSINEEYLVSRAIKSGISGYLLKETDMNNLSALVRVIARGCCYISTPIMYRIMVSLPELDRLPLSAAEAAFFQIETARIFRQLSRVERSVICLLAQGYSDREIAEELSIALGTVRNSITRARRKTGLRNRVQIVNYALSCGLINLSQIKLSVRTALRSAGSLRPGNGV